MQQIFILLVVAVFAYLNWMVKRGGSKPPQQPRPPARPAGPPREDDPLKGLYEALGIPRELYAPPTANIPRPLVLPTKRPATAKTVIQKQPAKPVPAATLPTPPSVPEAAPIPIPLSGPISDSFWQKAPSGIAPGVTDTMLDIRSLLKSPQSIRTAIILREVLGPPRSMQT